MDTQSVTAIRPTAPEHFASCTEQAIGRYVSFLRTMNGADVAFALRDLTAGAEAHRGFCTCFRIQLNHVEAELTRERKLQRLHGVRPGHTAAGDEAVIAELTVRRDALRQAVAK